MTFDRSVKTIQWGEEIFFQQIVLGQLDSHMEKNEIGSLHRCKSWIRQVSWIRQGLLDMPPKVKATEGKNR